jgi:peptide-methionine (S)-S-oxide reductase
MKNNDKLELATFGTGCFWQTEEDFRTLPGVKSTTVGFMGGNTKDPSYEDVSHKDTNHAEVVHIEFNSSEVSYKELLNVFWNKHDPTTLNRQGPDVGTQYRSAIFYHDEKQMELANTSKKEMDKANKFRDKIVTEIVPAGEFYSAEEYHQKYLQKRGLPSCHI